MTNEEREKLIASDWGKDAAKVRSRCEWLLGWGRGYDVCSGQLEALKKAFEFVCQERNEALRELEIWAREAENASRRQLSSHD